MPVWIMIGNIFSRKELGVLDSIALGFKAVVLGVRVLLVVWCLFVLLRYSSGSAMAIRTES